MTADVPIVAIVGFSNSGKTQVASALVRELRCRGYRVAAVKNAPHGHDAVAPGKDSARLFEAGAEQVVVRSPGQMTTISRVEGEPDLSDIAAAFTPRPDIVVAEGFKNGLAPKVLVRSDVEMSPRPMNVIAVMGEGAGWTDVPAFPPDRTDMLARFIEQALVRPASGDDEAGDAEDVTLIVDGVRVPLKAYPTSALDLTIRGFLQSLRGVPSDPRLVHIVLRRR